MPRKFSDWRRGDPLDAERLTQQHKARNEGVVGGRGINVVRSHDGIIIELQEDRIIPSSGGAAEPLLEVRVHKIVRCLDPADQNEIDICEDLEQFDHLRCYPVTDGGLVAFPLPEPYIPVFPNFGHAGDLNNVAWDATDFTQPVFTTFVGVRGVATMIFLEGLRLVAPPTNICGEAAATGACCDEAGICIGNLTQQACEDAGGLDFDVEASCVVGMPCVPVMNEGACCFDEPIPNTCAIKTSEECAALAGQYFGDGSMCTAGLCDGMPTGACCFNEPIPDTCEIKTPKECAALAGEYFSDGSMCLGGSPDALCIGSQNEACCYPTQSCQDLPAPTCLASGGSAQGPGTDCASVECPVPGGACCCDASVCGALCQCVDGVLTASDCFNLTQGNGTFHPGLTCAQIVCDLKC